MLLPGFTLDEVHLWLGEREIHMRLEDDHLPQEIQLECEAYSLSKCVGLVLPSNVTRLATGIFHAI